MLLIKIYSAELDTANRIPDDIVSPSSLILNIISYAG